MRVRPRPQPQPDQDSQIKHISPIYRDDVYEKLFGNRPFDSLSSDERCMLGEADVRIEQHMRDWAILYYQPYTMLEIEPTGLINPKHSFRRVKDAQGNNVFSTRKPQDEFHRSGKRVRLIISGNQAGKTQCGAAEAIWMSLGIHPYNQIKTPNRGRICGGSLGKGVMEVIWPKYEALMPRKELRREPSKYSAGPPQKVTYKNGSTAEFMSYEMGVEPFEGWVGDWVWFDEPPPKDIYTACVRGLMVNNGIMFITATPLAEAWMHDEIFLAAGPGPEKPDVFNFPMRGNPFISDSAVKSLEDACEDDEAAARLDGVFKHLSGLVYKDFGQLHRIKSFEIPKDWTRLMVQDYHPRKPCAVLWAAVDPRGTLYFYDELWADDTVEKISEIIKATEKQEYGRPVRTRDIDSISATPDRITGRNAMKEFRLVGEKIGWSLAFRSSVKKRDEGMSAVREYLKLKNGLPGCYFFEDKVPRTISSMEHYQYETKGEELPAHFADCLRYICVKKPQYRLSEQETDEG